jgi:hypothetical protein
VTDSDGLSSTLILDSRLSYHEDRRSLAMSCFYRFPAPGWPILSFVSGDRGHRRKGLQEVLADVVLRIQATLGHHLNRRRKASDGVLG